MKFRKIKSAGLWRQRNAIKRTDKTINGVRKCVGRGKLGMFGGTAVTWRGGVCVGRGKLGMFDGTAVTWRGGVQQVTD
jgi:transposase